MKIQLKLEASLKSGLPPDADAYEMPEGSTVADLMRRLGLAESQVMLAFVGEEIANSHTPLKAGGSVTLCPFICGG